MPTLHIQQASMERTDSLRQMRHDIEAALDRGAVAIGFTEMGDDTRAGIAANLCERAGYVPHFPRHGDTAVAIHGSAEILSTGNLFVHPGRRQRPGAHTPRYVTWADFLWEAEQVWFGEAHWITQPYSNPRRRARYNLMTEHVIEEMHGAPSLAFFAGDINEDDDPRNVAGPDKMFREAGIATTFDELGQYPNTLGRRTVDIIGSRDLDSRVTARRVKAWPRGHSNHRAVSAWYDLAPVPPPVVPDPPVPVGTITQRVVRNARRRGLEVLHHDQWGSVAQTVYAERRRTKPAKVLADTLVQHITVTLDHGPLTGDFAADMRTVEQIGLARFGSGVSYNFVVDMTTGTVGVGMPLDAKGTHTVNNKGVPGFSFDQNYHARAIAVLGMPGDQLSAEAEAAIATLVAAMVDEGALTRGFDYCPHSMFAAKDCPCDPTRNRMRAIRVRALTLVA